jgi:hypothetical protein
LKLSTSSVATLATLGLVGFASDAHATLKTITLDILPTSADRLNPIAIDSPTAQFSYNWGTVKIGHFPHAHFDFVLGFDALSDGEIASTGNSGFNEVDPSLTYIPSGAATMAEGPLGTPPHLGGTGFVNIAFTTGSGERDYGFAAFGPDGTLDSITYETAPTAVPEPPAWELLIAGAGIAGLITRGRRRSRLEAV